MSTSWDLSKLAPATFEHLVNALVLHELGNGATGFAPGPDAGRDGFFEGRAPYPSSAEHWNGVWYIQSKFHAPNVSSNAQAWLLAQLKEEIAQFRRSSANRKWPDNWILATNIDVTAGRGGTFDKARRLVSEVRPELAKRFHVWGGTKILELLNKHPAVAQRSGHFFTPGHVISSLLDAMADDRASVRDIVRALVVHGIREHRRTKIEQAGSREDHPPGVETLFVDLPYVAASCGSRGLAMAALQAAAAENHRPQGERYPDSWERWRTQPERAAVWFVRAGPGRGKSTVGQYFCQVQRAALLEQDTTIARRPEVNETVASVRDAALKLGVWPPNPRIPIWVELKSYAAWYGERAPQEPKGVLTWLAADLRRILELTVHTGTIKRALAHKSWVVVFDGLDEVPSGIKDAVSREVVTFVEEHSLDGDLLTVCTSRPQGYSGQFDALAGAVVELVDLEPSRALECASRVTSIGRTESESAAARLVLSNALSTPAVQEIMTTPLQAHIMAVLVRNGSRPPEKKWDLYSTFYSVIREREANRNLPDPLLRELLRGDSRIIDAVHQRLGFVLHAKAETASGADASLNRREFESLVRDTILKHGAYANVDQMVRVVVTAAMDRLVLINTPDSGSHVRFDIRAIQEFFAAAFLYDDVEALDLRQRLEIVAADVHWREVVQFLLGALVSMRRRPERSIAFDVLRWIDRGRDQENERPLARSLACGGLHAALLLSNGVAESDQQVRSHVRDLLDPLIRSVDWQLLRVLEGVRGQQTRIWLWGWAQESVRSRAVGESGGAVRTLAALARLDVPGPEEVISFARETPTAVLASFVDHAMVRQTRQERVEYPWDRPVLEILLSREDLLRAAPALVWQVLRAACMGKGSLSDYSGTAGQFMVKASGLGGIFSDPEHYEYGSTVVWSPRLTKQGRSRLEALPETGSASSILRWLASIARHARHPTASGAHTVLSSVVDGWYLLRVLPQEFTAKLPIPLARDEGTHRALLAILPSLSDEEYLRALETHQLQGIPLRRTRFSVYRHHPEMEMVDLDAMIRVHPELIADTASFIMRDQPNNLHDTAKRICSLLAAQPELALTLPEYALLFLVPFADPAVRKLLEDLGRRAKVDVPWSSTHSPRVQFSMPADEAFLVPTASMALSEARRILEGRHSGDARSATLPFEAARNFVSGAVSDYLSLRRMPTTEGLSGNQRAAAIILCALHLAGGVEVLTEYREQLLMLAHQGVHLVAPVALTLECLGAHDTDGGRLLISELLQADGRQSDDYLVTSLLGRWRERSRAPVTSSHSLDRWLAH